MMTRDEYIGHDAVGLAERIRAGELTAPEAVQTAIELAEQINPRINAIVCTDYEAALERAQSADTRTAFGGVPTFIKDNENVTGLPTRQGSHSMPSHPVSKSSDFTRQLLASGLTHLGKSTLPEFGLTCTTESIAMGPTRNPWNLEHSTGGSSGGSAALVAAGVVPVAHGNDGGGSIRIPASCCGLIGIKSSRGRLHSAEGAEKLPIDIISQGILSRSVRDTATFLAEGEKFKRDPALPELGLVEAPGTKRLRIGMFTDSATGEASHPDVVAAVEKAARLCADLGHHVEPMKNPYDERISNDFIVYWGVIPLALKLIGKREFGKDFDKSHFDQWTQGLASIGRRNLLRLPFVLRRLKKYAAQMDTLFGSYDMMLTPVLSEPPLKLGTISPDIPFDVQYDKVEKYCCFTPYQNLSGTPAISLPIGRSESGLPIGVQFAAPMGQDKALLELAYELEQAEAWNSAPAPLLHGEMAQK